MSGINLGYRTSPQIRARVEEAIGQIRTDTQMLCNELRMHEESYEMLREERNRLTAKVMERDAEIKRLKLDIEGWQASSETWRKACVSNAEVDQDAILQRDSEINRLKIELRAEKEHWRMLCDVIAKFRDEARREVCGLVANGSPECGTPTTVAADRDWSYLYGKEVVK